MQNQFLTEESAPAYVPFAAPPQTTPEIDTLTAAAETQAVTALLATTKQKVRRRKIAFWGSFLVMEGLLLIDSAIGRFYVWVHPGSHIPHAILGTLWGPLLVLAAIVSLLCTLLKPLGFDASELARMGGIRAIPTLLDSLLSGTSPGPRKVVYQALTKLLPQMQASDAHLLTAYHHRLLNSLLRWQSGFMPRQRNEPDFTIAILKAYEQVGDAKSIPAVEKLANYQGKSERKCKVREAARQCLPLLQSHLGELNTTQTLLRASSPSISAPDVLLRPVGEASPAPAGELLRAVEDESSPD